MFRANETQQITLHDSFLNLPEHVQRLVERSWAKDFADCVFPAINEERFAVLYSANGSRPNTPVNVLVGSMLLKEYFGQTEEELLMSIYCDVLYQYALHLTQEEKPPVSDRSWSRFRERLVKYEVETGIDLMKAEMESLAQIWADYMNLICWERGRNGERGGPRDHHHDGFRAKYPQRQPVFEGLPCTAG